MDTTLHASLVKQIGLTARRVEVKVCCVVDEGRDGNLYAEPLRGL